MLLIYIVTCSVIYTLNLFSQSNEAGNSNACELLGFKRAISFLTETEGLTIRSIVTDRHLSIAAHIRDEVIPFNPLCRNMQHWFDVWHCAKGKYKCGGIYVTGIA